MATEAGIKLLKETSWFGSASDELVQALAAVMEPEEATDGHVFVEEGEIIERFLIIESGKLDRTKKTIDFAASKDGSGVPIPKPESLRSMGKHARRQSIIQDSILVDQIQGRGHVTGLLHTTHEDTEAYATITAHGPAKVWSIKGEDFRRIISENPSFSLEFMQAMSQELRGGTKSVRALMEKIQKKGAGTKDNEQDLSKTCRVLCYDATSWVHDGFQPAIDAFNASQTDGYKIVMEFTTERLGEASASYAVGTLPAKTLEHVSLQPWQNSSFFLYFRLRRGLSFCKRYGQRQCDADS